MGLWASGPASAQNIDHVPANDSVASAIISDSIGIPASTAVADTIDSVAAAQKPAISSRIRRQKIDLDNVVNIKSSDSMIMVGRNRAIIYGNGQVDYGDMKLDADEIDVDLQNSTVYAVGRPDSVGEIVGSPVFEEGGSTYETKTMSYNFKTKRAFITDVVTQQGEGFLTGGQTKKNRGRLLRPERTLHHV